MAHSDLPNPWQGSPPHDHGDGRVLQFQRVADFGGAELLRARFGEFSFARHAHDRIALAMITRGRLAVAQPHGTEVATPGSVVLMNDDQLHWGGRDEAEGWSISTLYLDPSAAATLAREQGARLRGLLTFRSQIIRDPGLFSQLQALHQGAWQGDSRLADQGRLLAVLERALAGYGDCTVEPPKTGQEPLAVRRARDYLAAHPDRNISLDELAAVAGLSSFRLVRSFSASLGQPPHAFHLRLRLRHAMALLREGEPVAEVAVACGFVDQSHLTRAFKRAFGMTPGVFRRG